MKPVILSLGPIHIYSFGLTIALGVLLAVILMKRHLKTEPFLNEQLLLDLVFTTLFFGFLGGRVAYVIQHFDWYLKHPLEILMVWQGGLIFYGGLVGSLLGIYLFSRKRSKNYFDLLDFLIPYVALTHAFGRIGCFLNGCCYGKSCDLPWAVQFSHPDYPVHPTQLYEAFFNLLLFLGLAAVYRKRTFSGQVIGLYVLFYSLIRFVIEFFRAENPVWNHLTHNQWTSIVLVVLSLAALKILKSKKNHHG